MSILSRPHRFVKPAVCQCRLIEAPCSPCELSVIGYPGKLEINGTTYKVAIIGHLPAAPAEPVTDGYALEKDNGEIHHVCLVAGRLECTCGDWLWRRSLETDRSLADCKHCKAVRQLLQLPADLQPQPQPGKIGYRPCTKCWRYDNACTCPARPQEPAPVVVEFDDP